MQGMAAYKSRWYCLAQHTDVSEPFLFAFLRMTNDQVMTAVLSPSFAAVIHVGLRGAQGQHSL